MTSYHGSWNNLLEPHKPPGNQYNCHPAAAVTTTIIFHVVVACFSAINILSFIVCLHIYYDKPLSFCCVRAHHDKYTNYPMQMLYIQALVHKQLKLLISNCKSAMCVFIQCRQMWHLVLTDNIKWIKNYGSILRWFEWILNVSHKRSLVLHCSPDCGKFCFFSIRQEILYFSFCFVNEHSSVSLSVQ